MVLLHAPVALGHRVLTFWLVLRSDSNQPFVPVYMLEICSPVAQVWIFRGVPESTHLKLVLE